MSLSVLLADDSSFIRRVLSKELPGIFPGQKIVFTEAANGSQALDHLSREPFDLIFLDLTMPEKTGYEVLEELKYKGIRTNTIVLTADVQPEAEQAVMDLGAMGYIKKERPLNLVQIKTILKDRGMI